MILNLEIEHYLVTTSAYKSDSFLILWKFDNFYMVYHEREPKEHEKTFKITTSGSPRGHRVVRTESTRSHLHRIQERTAESQHGFPRATLGGDENTSKFYYFKKKGFLVVDFP